MNYSNLNSPYSGVSVSYKLGGSAVDINEDHKAQNDISTSNPGTYPTKVAQSVALQLAIGNRFNDVTTSKLNDVERIILQLVSQSNQDRVSYYKLMNEFENYYLCQAIYDVLSEEILRTTDTGISIRVQSDKYQELCDEAMMRFNIPSLIEQALIPLMHYGDYTFKINKVYEDQDDVIGHIVSISDDYVPGEVLGIYNNGIPIQYYRLPMVRSIRNNIKSVSGTILQDARSLNLSEVLHFSLRSNKIKLELDEASQKSFSTPVLHVGIGLLWGVIDRIILLKFREISTVASDLSRLTRPTIVGASVNQSDSSDKIMSHCRDYEAMLNNTSANVSQLTGDLVGAISATMANRYKVLPVFSSGRGEARKLGIEDQIMNNEDDRKIEDERALICQLAGVPPEVVLAKSGERQSPQRLYSRLNKKIKSVQRALTRPITQFLVHYVACETNNLEVSESDITVSMSSTSSIEDIDDSEALGYVLDNMKSIIESADTIKRSGLLGTIPSSDPHNPPEGISPINADRFMEYFRSELSKSGSTSASIWLTSDELVKIKEDAASSLEAEKAMLAEVERLSKSPDVLLGTENNPTTVDTEISSDEISEGN